MPDDVGFGCAEHHLRVLHEIVVDLDGLRCHTGPGSGQDGRLDVQPVGFGRWLTVSPTPEDEHVGHDRCAGGLLVGSARQPDRTQEITEGGHPLPGLLVGLVGAVEGVAAGDQNDDAAGPGELQALEDEVVVDRVATTRVVLRVPYLVLAERDVADHDIEVLLRWPGVGEGLGEDLRVRVEGAGDGRGDGVDLHADDLRVGGGICKEAPSAHAGFQHPQFRSGWDAEPLQGLPDDPGVGRIGVVRVQGRGPGLGVLVVRQDFAQMGAFGRERGGELLALVEQVRGGAPARPLLEHLSLGLGGRPVLRPQPQDDVYGRDVRGDPLPLRTRPSPGYSWPGSTSRSTLSRSTSPSASSREVFSRCRRCR